VQHPAPIDTTWQPGIEQASCSISAPPWPSLQTPEPPPTRIGPVLAHDAEPDPAFFVESWTIGVTAASQNYLFRHQRGKSPGDSPEPVNFRSFSFATFWNLDLPQAPAISPMPDDPLRGFPPLGVRDEEPAFAPGPLSFQTACCLLGVTAASTREQIRAAYRRMASRYHPDRLESTSPVDPQRVTDRMASINEAYRLLCDGAGQRSV
jgi:hypothetical protein